MNKPDRFTDPSIAPGKYGVATLYFDGGSRGNPGIAAGAAVLVLTDRQNVTVSQYLPRATNNEAEYTGLLIGLEKARELGVKKLKIHGDSQLVINQVKGTWKLKSENLRSLLTRVKKLLTEFEKVELEWIERARNHLADAAANACMDAGGKTEKPAVSKGESKLAKLLKTLQPVLVPGEFVFCSGSGEIFERARSLSIGQFREKEGIAVILPRAEADRSSLPYTAIFRQITLSVHSDLEAVGFLAIIASRLAKKGIAVNVISAYYHDHLFVPAGKAIEAMEILRELAEG
ncbi:ACT domain-containing protein [Pannus brasiliensis CCIBt3594]|uniref:ACT domain-containing protein n=1 Tax=Pannus brasiliensis CCIBt3594 TaxID=1427578 RepID=A0AAW9QV69_9CHRO